MHVYIETNSLGNKEFEMMQTLVDRNRNIDERVFTDQREDRMIAAIENCGLACRWLIERNVKCGAVLISSDKDGKDHRYNGEHDALFDILHDRDRYRYNRLKWSALYGHYALWLDRIQELAAQANINFVQDIPYVAGAHLEDDIKQTHQDRARAIGLNRNNCVKIDISGAISTITCNVCRMTLEFEQSDAFRPRTIDFRRSTIYTGAECRDRWIIKIKTPKQLITNFTMFHLGQHLKGS